MMTDIDRYLSTLLAYAPCGRGNRAPKGDYVSLIHVPVNGPERVYSISCDGIKPILTLVRFRETVWEFLKDCDLCGCEVKPSVEVLRAGMEADHPVFEFLAKDALLQCHNRSDGQPGMEYYLLMWKRGSSQAVAECWEPQARHSWPWLRVIGALQAVASQHEYAALEAGLAEV